MVQIAETAWSPRIMISVKDFDTLGQHMTIDSTITANSILNAFQ